MIKLSYRRNRWYWYHAIADLILEQEHKLLSHLIKLTNTSHGDGSRAHKGKASKGDIAGCALRRLCHCLFGRHPSAVGVEAAFHQVVACQQKSMLSQTANMCLDRH